MISFRPVLMGAVLVVSTGAAFAECDGRSLFEDTFDDDLTGWVTLPEHEAISDGKYVMTPTPGNRFLGLIPGFTFDEEDMCIEVDISVSKDVPYDAGIAFWAGEPGSYFFLIAGKNEEGETEVGIFVKSPEDSGYYVLEKPTGVTIGPEVTNNLMLTIDGTIVAGWVNGEQIVRYRIQPPNEAFDIGLYGQIDEQGGSILFDNFRVTRPKK